MGTPSSTMSLQLRYGQTLLARSIAHGFMTTRPAAASAKLIDGVQIAKTIRSEIKEEVDKMREAHNMVPGLAFVLVGERKDSQAYVKMKKKACAQAGFFSASSELPEDVSQDE